MFTESQLNEMRARVKRGAARLDEIHPGWRTKIDVERLALVDPGCCVIGQLYGSYHDGEELVSGLIDQYFESQDILFVMGFNCPDTALKAMGVDSHEPYYEAIEPMWVEEIRRGVNSSVESHSLTEEPNHVTPSLDDAVPVQPAEPPSER